MVFVRVIVGLVVLMTVSVAMIMPVTVVVIVVISSKMVVPLSTVQNFHLDKVEDKSQTRCN